MFSFAGAKVRRFFISNQIFRQERVKTSLFIDLYQIHIPFNGVFAK